MTAYPRRERPAELTALRSEAEDFFDLLRATFRVPPRVTLELVDVDADGLTPYGDVRTVAAIAMREAQALRRFAGTCSGVTNVDVVNVATALHSAIEILVATPAGHLIAGRLKKTRDRVNYAARITASLGSGTEDGIVELV